MQNANLHTKYRSAKNIMINRIERQEIGTKNPERLLAITRYIVH